MTPKIITEMEPHTRQRYHFAMSCFVRSYGRSVLNDNYIKQFCVEWSNWDVNPPLDNTVDQYFHYEYILETFHFFLMINFYLDI